MVRKSFSKDNNSWFRTALMIFALVVLMLMTIRWIFPEIWYENAYHHDGPGRHDRGAWHAWHHGDDDDHHHGWEDHDWGQYGYKYAGHLGWYGRFVKSCPPDQRWLETKLAMGRSVYGQGEVVSDADWKDFIETEVTPRLPDGYSVVDIMGHGRGEDGMDEPERSIMLLLVHDGSKREALHEIAAAWRERFNQNTVLYFETPSCVAFLQ